jgi:hypothetical protein
MSQKQSIHGDDHACRAVSALKSFMSENGLQHRTEFAARAGSKRAWVLPP